MGKLFKKPELQEATDIIFQAMYETDSKYNSGFTQFEIKKDLYKLKWIMDDYFKKADKFEGEDEWVEKMMQKRVIEILKK